MMIIPKMLLLFIPLLMSVEAQENAAKGQIVTSSFQVSVNQNAELKKPVSVPEIVAGQSKVSIVYPESAERATSPSTEVNGQYPIYVPKNVIKNKSEPNKPAGNIKASGTLGQQPKIDYEAKKNYPHNELYPYWSLRRENIEDQPANRDVYIPSHSVPKTSSSSTTTTSSPSHNENNYRCKQENGYEAIPNKCGFYVECNENVGYRSKCPVGLYFDTTVKFPDFPCAPPSQVKCQRETTTPKPQRRNLCPKPSGYFPLPLGDCGKFILCLNGGATEMACPPGLAYNPETSSCDWPINVPGCNPEAFKDFTCPDPILDEAGKPMDYITNHRYKHTCNNYIACLKGHPRLLKCETGFSFDPYSSNCVKSDVTNCED